VYRDLVRQPGQGLVEYGFIIAVVAVVAIAGVLVFGATVSRLMSTLAQTVGTSV